MEGSNPKTRMAPGYSATGGQQWSGLYLASLVRSDGPCPAFPPDMPERAALLHGAAHGVLHSGS